MKIWLVHDEWYPCLEETKQEDPCATMVEVPDELVGRFRKAERAFSKAHGQLVSLYEKARGEASD